MRHTIFDPPTAGHVSVWNVLKPFCFWRRGDLNSSGSPWNIMFSPFLDSKNMWYSLFWDKPQQQEYSHSGMRIENTRILDVNWYDLVWPQIRLTKVLVLWRLEHLWSFAVCRECLRLPAGHRVSGTVGALCWGPEDCVAKNWCVWLTHSIHVGF